MHDAWIEVGIYCFNLFSHIGAACWQAQFDTVQIERSQNVPILFKVSGFSQTAFGIASAFAPNARQAHARFQITGPQFVSDLVFNLSVGYSWDFLNRFCQIRWIQWIRWSWAEFLRKCWAVMLGVVTGEFSCDMFISAQWKPVQVAHPCPSLALSRTLSHVFLSSQNLTPNFSSNQGFLGHTVILYTCRM